MRTYEQTHPWLNFVIDLNRASPRFWILLGEAKSKCDHLAGIPLKPAVAQELMRIHLAKGAHATTAIEGNSLSEEDVRRRIDGKLVLPESREYQGREVDNVVAAFTFIRDRVLTGKRKALNSRDILEFNRMVLDGMPPLDGGAPGEIRACSVEVGRYRGAPVEDCPYLLDRMCNWLNEEIVVDDYDEKIVGLLRAIASHLYIAWIHPFRDGNGRTARLVEFKLLMDAGVPEVSAHLLSNHYNLTRSDYYRQLEAASLSRNILPFFEYALQGFVDGLAENIDKVRVQQLWVSWESYVHEVFRNRHGKTAVRQRRLVLAIATSKNPVPSADVRNLTPEMVAAYAGKTTKTISRDLNLLEMLGLVERVPGGYSARVNLLAAFLPRHA